MCYRGRTVESWGCHAWIGSKNRHLLLFKGEHRCCLLWFESSFRLPLLLGVVKLHHTIPQNYFYSELEGHLCFKSYGSKYKLKAQYVSGFWHKNQTIGLCSVFGIQSCITSGFVPRFFLFKMVNKKVVELFWCHLGDLVGCYLHVFCFGV